MGRLRNICVSSTCIQINKQFFGTKTGQWNTGSLNEDDARINAKDVGNEADSKSVFWLDLSTSEDETGDSDVVITRYGNWSPEGKNYVSVCATYERWYAAYKPGYAYSGDSCRPVQGSLPEIKRAA